MSEPTETKTANTQPDARKQRKNRNLAIAGAIAGFVVLVYLVTLLRIGATLNAGV